MPNLDDLLRSAPTEKLGRLMNEPETQKIFAMLSQSTGGKLEQAAGDAAQGNSAALMNAIRQLMKNPETAKLMETMQHKLK